MAEVDVQVQLIWYSLPLCVHGPFVMDGGEERRALWYKGGLLLDATGVMTL